MGAPPVAAVTATGRVRSLEETERRLAPLLDRVPVTRVYDATRLDRLGLPVWGAVTPLARDLTVHAGKGPTAQAARISAVMEAIERVSAEDVEPARVRRMSYRALRESESAVVRDPAAFDLPFDTRYDPDRAIGWLAGEDLLAGGAAWVALDLVLSPAREGVCHGPETNGLAAGNSELEATLHALYEIIERDAAAERTFRRRFGEGEGAWGARLVEADGLPEPASSWRAALEELGIETTLEDLTHDIGVPVFRAHLRDLAFPGREGEPTGFEGYGADLDATTALTRAVCEAAQAHTVTLLGARDTVEGGSGPPLSSRRLLAWLLAPSARVPFGDTPAPPADLDARLRVVLQRLAEVGFAHCVRVDLTRPDLGVPVVRVLLAGAAGPFGETTRRPSARLLRHLG